MDGKPLSRRHGCPARLVMPRMYGYKSVKWVTRIEVIDDDQRPIGYWEQRGYDKDAWIGGSNGAPRDRLLNPRMIRPLRLGQTERLAPLGARDAASSRCSRPG